MRFLRRTLLKIVFMGAVIFSPVFYVVQLSRVGSEKYNLYVSGSTKARTRGTGSSNTAIIQRTTTRLKKPQATELREKFFIAFAFGDQLTRATESLLALAALARYGNRSVAVPFVKDSMLHGTKIDQNAGTLDRYFDLNALNQKLDSYGYGLLKGWKHFQQRCNQSLNVLLNVLTLGGSSHARLSNSQRQLLNKTGWTPCFSSLQQTGNSRGVARIFQRGVTVCQNEGTHQIVMSFSPPVVPSFSSKRGHVGEKHVLIGRKRDKLGNQTCEV